MNMTARLGAYQKWIREELERSVSFWLKKKIGGLELAEANKKLLDSTRLMTIATSLGEGCTLIQIEHSGRIRIAVGLENKDDLLRDLSQALDSLAG